MAAAQLPETSYAVLGLVDKIPASSGYQLAAVAEESLACFWPISRTLLYRELRRLEDLGWVQGTAVRQQRLPDKRTYTLTAAGRQALADWLTQPGHGPTVLRNGFLLKFFYGMRMDPVDLRRLMSDYREALQADLARLTALVDELKDRPRARVGRLAALHGVRVAQAQLGWLDEVEAELAGEATRAGR